MSDERSERLRERRKRSQPSEQSESDESAEQSQTAEQSEQEQPSEPSKPSVKDENVGTYIYLPEAEKKQLDRVYDLCKAEYEYEFDTEFEKNRHFYPLVIEFGLDELDGASAERLNELVEDSNYI